MTSERWGSRGEQHTTWPLAGIVFASVVVAWAAGAGTPLLSLYQRDWGFPLWELTAAFTVYAVTLLLTLLLAGSLSDHLGRRPVLIGALILMLISSALFWVDDQVGWVIAARALQGVATGAATSTFAAAIIELSSARRRPVMTVVTSVAPVAGLALGALTTGVLTDMVHDPTRLVFGILAVCLVIGIVSVGAARETSARTPGVRESLRPRLVIPRSARRWFLGVAPLVAAGWMFSGLFLGLAPTFDRTRFGIDSGALNGVIVALQPASTALFGLIFTRVKAERSAFIGAILMVIGAALAVTGVASGQLLIVAVGAVAGGAGQGAGFGASLRVLAPLAESQDRGGLFAAIYLIAYGSYGLPVLVAGTLSGVTDLTIIVLAYGAVVIGLAVWAFISVSFLARRVPAEATTP
ncbi:MFS transporter [Herbiconiux solani]|uniref:MFS transporter n=1 Tax=Herbiconiux solani TaxID=661329 RepID=UPI000A89458F|nr:MFS transporter [Herbiconiux solani]